MNGVVKNLLHCLREIGDDRFDIVAGNRDSEE